MANGRPDRKRGTFQRLCYMCYTPRLDQKPTDFSEAAMVKLRSKVRFKVRYQVGFACPDVDDIVQETMTRFLQSIERDKITSPDSGAFLNGICRNVIFEFRRRGYREAPMPEHATELPLRGLPESSSFELREAIAAGMAQLSLRDRQVLRAFYIEEQTVEEILALTGMTLANFRVVLCRAKERFRQIYLSR